VYPKTNGMPEQKFSHPAQMDNPLQPSSGPPPTSSGPPTPRPRQEFPRSLLAEVNRLSSQTDQADPWAAEELGLLIRKHRWLINRLGGDLPRNVEGLLSTEVSGEVASIQAAIAAHLDQWREELCAESGSPLERMIVERLVTDWLIIYAIDQRAAAHDLMSPSEPNPWAAAQDRAHRRLLASAKALAGVRRTFAPLQIDLKLDGQRSAGREESAPRAGAETGFGPKCIE
jgi:hypothetical protein